MRPRDGDVARPLLCLGAAEIRDYCAERGVAYGEDVTNLQACYARNVIRLDVLPPLRRINPRVTETLAATADLAAAEAAVLADATAAALCRSWRNDDEAAGALDVQALLAEPPALRALVLHEWLRAAVGGALVERRVVDGVQKLTTARREGGRVSLRDGLEAVRGGGRLRLRRPRPHACDDVELAGGHLATEAASGVVVWFCGRAIRVWLRPGAHRGADAACGSLGLAGPPGTVSLHHPRRAERFAPSGLGAETTVARFLAAARVPPDLRAMSLVVGLDGTVAWVGFPEADGRLRGRVADHARVDESTKWTLHISEEER
jgi:tRNA(Ile)-lysidine synthase